MASLDVVALGEPLWELSQVPGDEARYLMGYGGDTSNFAVAAARQGARTAYVTRLGQDAFGGRFLALWRKEGIDTSGVELDAEAPTGGYFISHGPSGHVFTYMRAGSAASRMRPDRLPLEVIQSGRYFHASGISQAISTSACDAVFAAIDAARGAGACISYDSNLRPKLWPLARARALTCAAAALADYFFPSIEDARALSGLDDPEAIVDWAHRLGARHVLLKLGSDGVIASDATRRERIAGLKIDSVDATGAGDCFAGACIARLARGDDLWSAARYANAAAALATTGYGAVVPLPHPDAVRELLGRA
jgi:2-dehydro-3-deoxygluconokinase